MAAGKFKVYEYAKQYLQAGTINLESTNLKVALFLSTSNCNTLSVGTGVFGDLTNQVAGVFGYTTGGQLVAGNLVTHSGGTAKFDCTDPVFTAAGGSIVARFAVLYIDATVNAIVKPLIAVCLMDTTPADITCIDGNTLTIQINASGILTLTGATTD